VEEKSVGDKKWFCGQLSLNSYLLFHEVSKHMGLHDSYSSASSSWGMGITQVNTCAGLPEIFTLICSFYWPPLVFCYIVYSLRVLVILGNINEANDEWGCKWDSVCLCVLWCAALSFQNAYLSYGVQNISVLFTSRHVVFVCKTTVSCSDFTQAVLVFCIQGK
jgi:hypothetical protein